MLDLIADRLIDLGLFFIKRPRLDIEIVPSEEVPFIQKNNGLSANNPSSVYVSEARYSYTFQWLYTIIIRNNSSVDTYDLRISVEPRSMKIEPLGRTKALKAGEEMRLNACVEMSADLAGRDLKSINTSFPSNCDEYVIKLVYRREMCKRKFYSCLSFTAKGQARWFSKRNMDNKLRYE